MNNIKEVLKNKKFILIGIAIAIVTLLIAGGLYINHQQNEKEQAKIEAQEKKDVEKKAAQEKEDEEKAKAEAEKLKAEQEAKKAEEEKNKVEEMAVIYYSKGNQDVYSEKENKGKKLVTLVDAQAIQITGKTQDGYYRVDWMGDVGYMKADTLTATNPAEAVANNSTSSNSSNSSNSGSTSSSSSSSSSSSNGGSWSGSSSGSGSSSNGGSSNSGSTGGSTGGSTAPAVGYNSSATQQFNDSLVKNMYTQGVGGTHYNMLMAYINNGTPVQAGVDDDVYRTTGQVQTAQITYPYKSSYDADEINDIIRAHFATVANYTDSGVTNYIVVTNNGDNTVTIKLYHLGVKFNF